MWYVLEYKLTPKSRKWIFQSMSGDKKFMEQLKTEYEASGFVCRLKEQA